jgi:prepilin peptidase CpaA
MAANYFDVKYYKIKNGIILPMLIIGLGISVVEHSLLDAVYGMFIPLVLFPLYALKMLGAGDIKAFCAIGAVVGFKLSIQTMLFSFLSGGVLAMIFMLLNKNMATRFKYVFNYLKLCLYTRKILKYDFGGKEKSYFRFSYAISAGFIATIFNGYFNFI